MLKSCRYCNQLHPFGFICPKKPITANRTTKTSTKMSLFRSTQAWTRKALEIKERDLFLCQICIRKLYEIGTREYNFDSLQVHHIIPLAVDWESRLEDDKLLTLCSMHHKMAELGRIPATLLLKIAMEQEEKDK